MKPHALDRAVWQFLAAVMAPWMPAGHTLEVLRIRQSAFKLSNYASTLQPGRNFSLTAGYSH